MKRAGHNTPPRLRAAAYAVAVGALCFELSGCTGGSGSARPTQTATSPAPIPTSLKTGLTDVLRTQPCRWNETNYEPLATGHDAQGNAEAYVLVDGRCDPKPNYAYEAPNTSTIVKVYGKDEIFSSNDQVIVTCVQANAAPYADSMRTTRYWLGILLNADNRTAVAYMPDVDLGSTGQVLSTFLPSCHAG